MSVHHAQVWCLERLEDRVRLDPLELKSQMIVSHHAGARD